VLSLYGTIRTPHAGIWLKASVAESLDGPAFVPRQKRLVKSTSAKKARCKDRGIMLIRWLRVARVGSEDSLTCLRLIKKQEHW
jgi:hypothetical protein